MSASLSRSQARPAARPAAHLGMWVTKPTRATARPRAQADCTKDLGMPCHARHLVVVTQEKELTCAAPRQLSAHFKHERCQGSPNQSWLSEPLSLSNLFEYNLHIYIHIGTNNSSALHWIC